MLTGKTKMTSEEKEAMRMKKQKQKDKYEFNNLTGFEMAYPPRITKSQPGTEEDKSLAK